MGKSLGGETEVQMSDPLMREAVRMVGQEVSFLWETKKERLPTMDRFPSAELRQNEP